jgi:hypothetical protein
MRPSRHSVRQAWRATLAIFVVGALFAPVARATYLPTERIPTNSPLYRDLERLAATWGETPRFLSTRPLRVAEAHDFLVALAGEYEDAEHDPAYRRALRLLDPGAAGATRPFFSRDGEDGERVTASPYVSMIYSDDPRNVPDINRDYRAGVQVAAALDSNSVLVVDVYEGTASQGGRGTPNFGTGNALIEGVDVNSWVEEAYAEFRLGKLRALAGHTWLRWGPGREGTLALSDAAPALDMVRAELGLFRRIRFQWFVSLLDPGPETFLAGHRVEWTPGKRVTVGFTELARFDGSSQAILYTMPLVPYSFWEKRPKTSVPSSIPGDTSGVALAKNNVLWSADVSWAIKPGLRAWGEFMVDDISFSKDYKPDMVGYQAGLEARRTLGGGARAVGGSLEYTRVNNFTYSAWHGHDFGSEGFPIGFVQGPDVASLAGEIAYEHGASWEFRARGEWRKKGEGAVGDAFPKEGGVQSDASKFQGVVERETRVSGSVIYAPARWLRLEATVGADHIKNLDHVTGADEDGTALRLGGRVEW